MDDLRPKGTVEVKCSKCGWSFWLDALHPSLPDGPFICMSCEHGPNTVYMKKGDTAYPVKEN